MPRNGRRRRKSVSNTGNPAGSIGGSKQGRDGSVPALLAAASLLYSANARPQKNQPMTSSTIRHTCLLRSSRTATARARTSSTTTALAS